MNKFSELIARGVAKFEYTPIASSLPTQCPICRAYNNVYSLANDTHMSALEDERLVITGHAIRDHRNFDYFLCSCYWGAMNFLDSGLGAPCTFFYSNKLKGHYDILNGDEVYILEPIPEVPTPQTVECPDCVCCVGTAIPEQLRAMTVDGNAQHIKEAFKQQDVAKALNEDINVCGINWIMVGLSDGDHAVCVGKKKTYIL